MKYSELQTSKISDLTDKICAMRHSLDELKDNIQEARQQLAHEIIEHEIKSKKIEGLKSVLYTLLANQESEKELYEQANKELDACRFNAFRDDRGVSVPSIPVGPLAIVPLGNSGVTSPNIQWDDEDSPHLKEQPKPLIDFKECYHKRFDGPFIKYCGTYTCNNCDTKVIACLDCKEKKNEQTKTT